MPRVLLTAYGPYEEWPTNASWLAIEALTRELPSGVELVTRRYPVDFAEVKRRLESDLTPEIDFAIHLGQAPGSGVIQLEALGINVARPRGASGSSGAARRWWPGSVSFPVAAGSVDPTVALRRHPSDHVVPCGRVPLQRRALSVAAHRSDAGTSHNERVPTRAA